MPVGLAGAGHCSRRVTRRAQPPKRPAGPARRRSGSIPGQLHQYGDRHKSTSAPENEEADQVYDRREVEPWRRIGSAAAWPRGGAALDVRHCEAPASRPGWGARQFGRWPREPLVIPPAIGFPIATASTWAARSDSFAASSCERRTSGRIGGEERRRFPIIAFQRRGRERPAAQKRGRWRRPA